MLILFTQGFRHKTNAAEHLIKRPEDHKYGSSSIQQLQKGMIYKHKK